MANTSSGDNGIEGHVRDKRDELIWALFIQDYTYSEIGRIFNMHRASVKRIVARMPKDWTPKWQKIL